MSDEKISKFIDAYVNAGTMDSGDVTITKVFAEAMIIAQPVAPLEERGVIEVKDVGENGDKAVFTVMPESTLTWTEVDARGSEDHSIADSQTLTAPVLKEAQPTTKSATIFIGDNVNLVNPLSFKEYAKIAGNQVKQKKISDAIAALVLLTSYSAGTSIRNAGGFTAKGAVASDDTLSPNDLVSAKLDMKGATTPVLPDAALLHSNQKNQLENHANFSPGQTTNANYKKATFDVEGNLSHFDGMELIECLEAEMPIISAGDFSGVNGHECIVGRRDLMLGRGENNRKNTVEDFRNPAEHGIRRTLNVNYAYVIKYPDGIRVLQCAE